MNYYYYCCCYYYDYKAIPQAIAHKDAQAEKILSDVNDNYIVK